ncbi:MAG: cupin domain-containing protein [Acidobacteria bacterium]|nr:cupin domain-containing protein [Acidobacteriota bacterium]
MRARRIVSGAAVALAVASVLAVEERTQAQGSVGPAPQGVTYRAPSGTTLRLMLDETNLGSEVSLGEMVFPPNQDSGEHAHDAIEIFYVVSGELEHVVNGRSQILKPGMSGFVRPPDKVRHKTGPAGAKVVVVWSPGIEGRRVASRWQREP